MRCLPSVILALWLCLLAAPASGVSDADNGTLKSAPLANKSNRTAAAPTEAAKEDDEGKYIYIKHIRTIDLPQNKNIEEAPQRIFVLDLLEIGNEWAYGDIIFETNAGIGVMRGELGTSEATRERYLDIECRKHRGDNCSPQKIIIYRATEAWPPVHLKNLGRNGREEQRSDIMDLLRQNTDTVMQFETKDGLLPLPEKAVEKKKKTEILVAYETEMLRQDGTMLLRLTFPQGQRDLYTSICLATSNGYGCTERPEEEALAFRDFRMPDFRLLGLSRKNLDKDDPDYVPPSDASPPATVIRSATAIKNGKKTDILPWLRTDPFVSLPVWSQKGPVPLGRHYNTIWKNS